MMAAKSYMHVSDVKTVASYSYASTLQLELIQLKKAEFRLKRDDEAFLHIHVHVGIKCESFPKISTEN